MLSTFDWLLRSRTGAELLATVRVLERRALAKSNPPPLPTPAPDGLQLAPPHSGLGGPCLRCWFYAPQAAEPAVYCPMCRSVLSLAAWLHKNDKAKQTVIIWGFVNQLPQELATGAYRADKRVRGAVVTDHHHFLVALYQRSVHHWLRKLLLYEGLELRGVLSIFPAEHGPHYRSGELLCQVAYQERRFAFDQLRVRFLPTPQHILRGHKLEREGLITFDAVQFMGMLESAAVFRAVMLPDEQQALRKVLAITDPNEAQFYWGRFLGMIPPEAKDMLTAWKVRQWSPGQHRLFFELVNYAAIHRVA
ncbi:MAG: hypothetical protein NZ528_14900 [Caldilineales bacterium]|nr:hypothetical protein [Caldilineales bacterium]MDW8317469.1 hypothetical protein [Anaerolineae bacterium]